MSALTYLVIVAAANAWMAAATSPDESGPAVIPLPAKLVASPGSFRITSATRIVVDLRPEVRAIGEALKAYLHQATGLTCECIDFAGGLSPENAIHLSGPTGAGRDESYGLRVRPNTVSLEAESPEGLFRGVQTIRQLLKRGIMHTRLPESSAKGAADSRYDTYWTMPCVQISDAPRHLHRGMLLDCGRHFMPVEFVKRYIDLLAYHKMNVLHWHLTEDQGWRIEIKKHPKLTEIGAWRKATRDDERPRDAQGRYGGFYTQEQIRDVVAYAKSRYVTVIPEIEMPGHALAALAAYPELSCNGKPLEVCTQWGVFDDVYCAGNDKVFDFLQDVLGEVIDLFPGTYIHVGGDECPKTRWEKCPKCQARMKAEHLKNEHELQSYFIRRIEAFLNGKGRRLIGWDEILEGGIAPNATVQSWRGMDGAIAAATAGHDVICSPTSHCYLDYAQWDTPGEPTFMGYVPLETTYSFEPTPPSLKPDQARHILGVEGNLWSEHAPPSRVDWQVFPRLCAVAEVGWSPKASRDMSDFQRRMRTHFKRLDALGVTYFIPPPALERPHTGFIDAVDVAFTEPFGGGEIRYSLDGSEPTVKSLRYTQPFPLNATTPVNAVTLLPSSRRSNVSRWLFKKLRINQPAPLEGGGKGLKADYFEGDWKKAPDFAVLKPTSTGVTPRIDLSAARRDRGFSLRLSGFIRVPSDGVYTFYVKADDGCRLRVGTQDPAEVETRAGRPEQNAGAWLKPGLHPILIEYHQVDGPRELSVTYEGPGIARQPIPAEALSHAGR